MRTTTWSVVLATALMAAGCGGDEEGGDVTASNQTSGSGRSNSTIQCEPCAAGFSEVVDSSARCGYRCVPMSDDQADAGASCVRECPDGFRVRLNPQNECGFFCEPIPPGDDGEEFLMDVGVDAEQGDAGNADAESMDAEPLDAEEDTSADSAMDDATPDADPDVSDDAVDDVTDDAVDDVADDVVDDVVDDVAPDAPDAG